jgi:hypothetical protein
MKKLESKLFQSLKLSDKVAKNLIGGLVDYTSSSKDSNTSGGRHDIMFVTTDGNGGNESLDRADTGTGTTDQGI